MQKASGATIGARNYKSTDRHATSDFLSVVVHDILQ